MICDSAINHFKNTKVLLRHTVSLIITGIIIYLINRYMHTSLLLRMIYMYIKIFYISRTMQYIFYIHILLYIIYVYSIYVCTIFCVEDMGIRSALSLSLINALYLLFDPLSLHRKDTSFYIYLLFSYILYLAPPLHLLDRKILYLVQLLERTCLL